MVVEIQSPGDETYEKLPFYAELGVSEVWIINRDSRSIEVYALRTAATGAAATHSGRLAAQHFDGHPIANGTRTKTGGPTCWRREQPAVIAGIRSLTKVFQRSAAGGELGYKWIRSAKGIVR